MSKKKSTYDDLFKKINTLQEENLRLTEQLEIQKSLNEIELRESETRFKNIFEQDRTVKLLIDPVTGIIEDANRSAVEFYGYSKEILVKKNIADINILSDEEVKAEMKCAMLEKKNYFNFRHQLSTGEIRDVQVYSSPIVSDSKIRLLSLIHDVTNQKKAERALDESRIIIQTVLDNIPLGVFAHNLNGDILLVNKTSASYTGYTQEELLGMNVSDIDPESITRKDREVLWQKLRFGNHVSITSTHIKKDGSKYPAEIFITAIELNREKILLAIAHDISERIDAERKIKESEAKYRLLAENMLDLVAQHNLDGTYSYLSPSVYNLLGYEPEELLGKNPYNLFHPDDLERIRKESHERALSGDVVTNIEYRIRRKDGEYIWFETNTKPILNDEGDVIKLQTHSQDISERKLAELRLNESLIDLKLAQEIAKVGNWQFDPKVGQPVWSDEVYRIYERDPSLGTPSLDEYSSIYEKDQFEIFINSYNAALQSGKSYSLKLKLVLKEKRIKYIRSICNPVYKTSKGYFLRGTIQDITEEVTRELKLLEREEQLKEINATKDKLFSIISHDLKGPLSSIIGFSELIEHNYNNYSEEKIKRFNNLIYKSSKSISDILENLLIWSRSQRNKLMFEPEKLNLFFLVEKTIDLEQGFAERKKVIIKNKIKGHYEVFADENMLLTILRNLLSNAIKFSHEGGKIIMNATKLSNMLKISVQDFGVGIEDERAKQMFKLADVESTKGTAGEEGTGLGLTICKEFVERHGGKIWMESNIGKGATFYFTLPLE